jgi:hypothetical protein
MASVLTFVTLLIFVAALSIQTNSQTVGAGNGASYIATATIVYFVSTSPILIQNAVLSMLELIGCLWIVLLLWLSWYLDHLSTKRWIRPLSLALILLVITLTKYSYGAFVIPAVVAAIFTEKKSFTVKKSRVIEVGIIILVLAIIIGFWFMVVGLQGILRFAFDQPQYAPFLSIENIFFYPSSWLNDFHLHPLLGILTVLLAFWGVIKGWNRFSVRVACWVTLCSFLILTISLNNQPRHLTVAAPCIWFLAAIGLTHLLVLPVQTNRLRTLRTFALFAMFVLFSLAVFQRAQELQPMLTYAFEGVESERVVAMHSYVLDNVDFEERFLILGAYDHFNELGVRWQGAIATGRAPSEISVDTAPNFDSMFNEVALDNVGEDSYETIVLKQIATQGYYRQIVVISGKNSIDPYVVAAPSALSDFDSINRRFDEYRIDIIDIGGRD